MSHWNSLLKEFTGFGKCFSVIPTWERSSLSSSQGCLCQPLWGSSHCPAPSESTEMCLACLSNRWVELQTWVRLRCHWILGFFAGTGSTNGCMDAASPVAAAAAHLRIPAAQGSFPSSPSATHHTAIPPQHSSIWYQLWPWGLVVRPQAQLQCIWPCLRWGTRDILNFWSILWWFNFHSCCLLHSELWWNVLWSQVALHWNSQWQHQCRSSYSVASSKSTPVFSNSCSTQEYPCCSCCIKSWRPPAFCKVSALLNYQRWAIHQLGEGTIVVLFHCNRIRTKLEFFISWGLNCGSCKMRLWKSLLTEAIDAECIGAWEKNGKATMCMWVCISFLISLFQALPIFWWSSPFGGDHVLWECSTISTFDAYRQIQISLDHMYSWRWSHILLEFMRSYIWTEHTGCYTHCGMNWKAFCDMNCCTTRDWSPFSPEVISILFSIFSSF